MNSTGTGLPQVDGATQQRRAAVYRLIWRWHFYAGLLCIPLVLVLSLSGAIYLFKPQLDARAEQPFLGIAAVGIRLQPDELIARALAAVPDARFLSWRLSSAPDAAQRIDVMAAGVARPVYLHPYSGEVLATDDGGRDLVGFAHDLHGELLLGRWGSLVVELAACWAIVLLVSGLYLWWPRGRSLAGVLYPRLHLQGHRFWKDLHSVVGFWITGFTLFLLISGLPWTTVWGGSLKEIRQWYAARQVQQDWHQGHTELAQAWGAQAVDHVNLPAQVVATATALGFAAPAELSVADIQQSMWKLSSQTQNRPLRADAWIDGGSGAVLRQQCFADKPLLDRIIGYGIAAHEGQLFGLLNQLLGVLTALGLVLVCISGAVMWWRRRPAGGLAAPSAMMGTPAGLPLTVLVILALLLPVLGMSLLVLWALWVLERLVLVVARSRR